MFERATVFYPQMRKRRTVWELSERPVPREAIETRLLAVGTDWAFVSWSGDVINTSNPVQFIITENARVTATFMQTNFRIFFPVLMKP